MNVPEDYDDEVEYLNTHPYLLPPADDDDKILVSNSVVLHKALGTTERTVSFAGTVPTKTTGTEVMTQIVSKRICTPHNCCRSALGQTWSYNITYKQVG